MKILMYLVLYYYYYFKKEKAKNYRLNSGHLIKFLQLQTQTIGK